MSNKPIFCDIHCHPTIRTFNQMNGTKQEESKFFNPFTIMLGNNEAQQKGGRAFSYSQSDMAKMLNGKAGVVFAALYPMEKGFFTGGGKLDTTDMNKIYSVLDKLGPLGKTMEWRVRQIARDLFGSDDEYVSGKDILQGFLMKLSLDRVRYFQSPEYDYWKDLCEEYQFLVSTSGIEMTTTPKGGWFKTIWNKLFGGKDKNSYVATGSYVVCRDYNEVKATVDAGKVAVIVTIEGGHSFSTDTSPGDIFKRIDQLKNWQNAQGNNTWRHPVLFITFAHHFYNFLCGQAHSLPDQGLLFFTQARGMNEDMTELGFATARYLLNLGPDNKPLANPAGPPIYLDVKHMSARTRKSYYYQIVQEGMQHMEIPVIASHVAYSGIDTLDQQIMNMPWEKTDYQPVPGLNGWNINMCNEDLYWIIKTKGLFGMNFDERIEGVVSTAKESTFNAFALNIQKMAEAISKMDTLTQAEKEFFWEVLCVGSDFDGYIDPVNAYSTYLDMGKFRTDLQSWLQAAVFNAGLQSKYCVPAGATAESLADGICVGNVMRFLERIFNYQTVATAVAGGPGIHPGGTV